MAKNEEDDRQGIGDTGNSYAKFTGLAFQMIAIIGVMTYAGYKIDTMAGHTVKWVTVILSLTGVFSSLYFVFRSVRN